MRVAVVQYTINTRVYGDVLKVSTILATEKHIKFQIGEQKDLIECRFLSLHHKLLILSCLVALYV